MEDKEREEMESALEPFKGCENDLDQKKSISEEELKEMDIAQGPGAIAALEDCKGIESKIEGEGVVVDFGRILQDFPQYQDAEGKFKLLDKDKYHLEKVDDSIQLFETGQLIGVMFEGDELDLDFGNQTAKVINNKIIKLTFGQKAVGTTLKITEDVKITQARSLMAAAVDLLEEVHRERTDNGAASSTWVRNVLRTEAFNQLVNASGSLVKYISWQD